MLCRLQHTRLRELANARGDALAGNSAVPEEGGVYCFWWTGPASAFVGPDFNSRLILKGPGGRDVSVIFDEEWLGWAAGGPVPLYVGKTTSGLRARLRQHLLLQQQRLLEPGRDSRKTKRPTTSCQLRAGVEDLFPHDHDSRPRVLDCVGYSYVVLPGDENAANRFYLEDLAVGLMRPPLNVDIER